MCGTAIRGLLLLPALLAALATSAIDRPAMPEDVVVQRDVVYARRGGQELRMDLYRSQYHALQPVPAVIYIHGGAWRDGRKDQPNPILWELARRGMIGVAIEYRLTTVAPFPAQLEDCRAALSFLRAEAPTYGIDPGRVGVWGPSAGGHLAALLATFGSRPENATYRVQACAALFPITDLVRLVDFRRTQPNVRADLIGARSPEWQLLGQDPRANRRAAEAASPITYVNEETPPFLLVHGTVDDIVPSEQSLLLQNALRAAKVRSELHLIPGLGHEMRFELFQDLVVEFFLRELR